jgi:hypothetical protein
MFGEGPGTTTVPAAGDPYRSIVVVIPFEQPYSDQPFYVKGTNVRWPAVLKHKFGRTNLFDDGATFQLITDFQDTPPVKPPFPKGTITFQSVVLAKYGTWARTKADLQALFDLVIEALDHGMVPEATAWAKELFDLSEQKKPQLPERVVRFLSAYRSIKDEMEKLPPLKNDAEGWKENIDVQYQGAQVQTRKHFSLIYWDASEAELATRFTRLEDNFRAFYLWHATQGVALKLPTRPLIAVHLKGANEFYPIWQDFAGMTPMADAFLAPHFNILVISPERTDGVGRSFRMSNRNVYREGMTRQQLLAGGGPQLTESMQPMGNPIGPGPGAGPGPIGRGEGGQPGPMPGPGVQPIPKPGGPVTRTKEEVARAQTIALVERFDEDASEIAAVSSDGSRQLLFACGLFPEHVDLPAWLTTGAGEFFHRPRTPVYTPTKDNKSKMAFALTTGYGRPNFAMHYQFNELDFNQPDPKNERSPAPPAAQILRNILTDAYFNAASIGKDIDNPKNTPKEGADEARRLTGLRVKAQATAWALYYDLAKNHTAELHAFLLDLGRLPRDVAVDRDTKVMIFARSFQLLDDKGNLNEKAFDAFAQSWLASIRRVPPAWETVEVTTPAPAAGAPGVGPGGPMGPMLPMGEGPGPMRRPGGG